MAQRRFVILLIVAGICCVLADNGEYLSSTEHPNAHATQDRLLQSIVRSRNASKPIPLKIDDGESAVSKDKKVDKKPRTVIHGPSNAEAKDKSRLHHVSTKLHVKDSSCCGSRFGSNPPSRPQSNYNRLSSDNGVRHSTHYGERVPIDRYGWQPQSRPPTSGGNSIRPSASGSYGGSYGGSGVYGGSQAGDRFGHRPVYGSESSSRPPSSSSYGHGNVGGYSYGETAYGYSGRPSGYGGSAGGGSYGISGTLADGDEFGPPEPGYPEGGMPQHPPNIHAQKAVALKALAGVALIGAAAALAANPILLPIGVLAGRRKRSENTSEEDFRSAQILAVLRDNFPKVYSNVATDRLNLTPRCVARLTCEIQKDYLADLTDEERRDLVMSRKIPSLIQASLINVESVPINIKVLLDLALSIGSSDGNCHVFTCGFMADN